MAAKKPGPELLKLLERFEGRVSELSLGARTMVLKEAPTAGELALDVKYAVTNAFTYSGRFKEAFCYVVTYRNHVNIGFARGSELPDPEGRLEGTGKLHRHVRIAGKETFQDQALRGLIRAAVAQAEMLGTPVRTKARIGSRG